MRKIWSPYNCLTLLWQEEERRASYGKSSIFGKKGIFPQCPLPCQNEVRFRYYWTNSQLLCPIYICSHCTLQILAAKALIVWHVL